MTDIAGKEFNIYDVILVADLGKNVNITEAEFPTAVYFDYIGGKVSDSPATFTTNPDGSLNAQFKYKGQDAEINIVDGTVSENDGEVVIISPETGAGIGDGNISYVDVDPLVLVGSEFQNTQSGYVQLSNHVELYNFFINAARMRDSIENINTSVVRFNCAVETTSSLNDNIVLNPVVFMLLDQHLTETAGTEDYSKRLSVFTNTEQFRKLVTLPPLA